MALKNELFYAMQVQLRRLRFFSLPVDGLPSPEFDAAVCEFKASVGFARRPYFTEATLRKLDVDPALMGRHPAPWMNEISRYIGFHEKRNYLELSTWLKSDGKTLGDPRVLPWCGDAVETALRLTMEKDVYTANLGSDLKLNPYWAKNWAQFGSAVPWKYNAPPYGAIATFSRTGGGHVGLVAGFDPTARKLLIRGGNQSDSISDVWLTMDGPIIQTFAYPTWPVKASGGFYKEEDMVPAPIINSKNNRTETNLS